MSVNTLPDRFPYQEYQFQKILRRHKTAVIGKPGCGKTRPIIDATVELGCINKKYLGFEFLEIDGVEINLPAEVFPKGPIFVMCSGPAIATWLKQFPQWVNNPRLRGHMHVITGSRHKNKSQRLAAWKEAATVPGIYLTNFTCFREDFHVIRQIPWTAVIADEYHKVMRSRGSTTFKHFRSWTRHMDTVLLATGSVWSKQPGSMWTAFVLVEPALKLFRSYWRYLKTYCIVEEGAYGQEILGLKNVQGLKDLMDKYFAYVPAEVIADQQPKGLRVALDVEMDKQQVKIYRDINTDMLSILDTGDIIIAPTVLGRLLKLRQLLCCPRILDESLGMGAGFAAICDKLEDEPHAIIFVPFRPAVGFVANELRAKGYTVEELKGGIDYEEQAEALDRFRNTKSIIVCTIAYAESFDCETCNTSYFLGYDFNVDPNEQAEGRTQRAISKHEFVTWSYVRYANTIDEFLLENLTQDLRNLKRVLTRPQELINVLKGIQP